jgi:TolB-like protein/Flp pilus assembly protein TadD
MDRALAGLPADENLTRYAELCSYWLGYQFEGTEKSARAWLAATPGASFPAWILAQSALVRRHPEEALKWAAQASADPEITGVRSFVTTFEVCYYLQADVAAAQAALDHVPISQRSVHRVLASRWLVAMAGKHFDQALQELNRAPEAMLRDRLYHGPKALLAGLANEAAGRRDVASAQFGEAEKILRTELTADPDNQELRAVLALSLACQGRSEEARRELAAVEPLLTGQDPTVYTGHLIALIAQVHGVLGEIDRMVPWLRILFTKPSQVPFTPASLRQDPRFGRYAAEPLLQAVLAEFTPAETAAPAAAAAARVDDKSVAVLAFANLSDDKANEYFSDGISEELLNVLAKVPGLKVTARTSSFHFKGKDTSVPEIARQLGVAYVIEGSVRKQGNKVRITAQLIKAADGFHVWSDTFTRELQDIFAVQDEIAGLIAQNFQLKLGAGNTSGDRSTNVEAWQLYLAGRRAWNLRTPEGYREAETLFQRAIALDGHLARAYAALADVWQIRAIDENAGAFSPQWRTLPTAIKSRALIDKALEIDPRCAEAHASLGLNLQLGWQDEPAMQAFRRAIELNPNYATAHQWLGLTLVGVGKMDEGLPEVKLAAELDPLSARILSDYAKALNFSGHPQEALVVSLRALAIQPGAVQAVLQEARALASLGRPMEGVALVEGTGKAGLSERMRLEALAILAAAAQPEAIRRLIGDVDALPASPLKFASLVALGRIDAALADPESSMAWDGWGLSEAAYGRLFEPIRGDARFQKMIETSGRADYFHRAQAWRAAHPPVNSTAKP